MTILSKYSFIFFHMSQKWCPKCKTHKVVKNGKKDWRQAYKCNHCAHKFVHAKKKSTEQTEKMRNLYTVRKQTYQEVAQEFNVSTKTVQRTFDKIIESSNVFYNSNLQPCSVYVIMDVTRFGKELAMFMIKSCQHRKIIYAKVVAEENIEIYREWLTYIKEKWREILWATTDLLPWIREYLSSCMAYQACQFHQIKLIKTNLGKYPQTEAWRSLKYITFTLTKTTKESFENELNTWYKKYETFVKERTYSNVTKRRRYTHDKLRRSYKSLVRNLPFLFTYLSNSGMQNTTNMLDWYFSPLKSKVHIHHGLSKERKVKVIFSILAQ